jgi:hypothetical protein
MPTSDYTPALADVGALMRARTKDKYGAEVGTFNTNTRPTAAEATSLIATAAKELAISVGADLPDGPDGDENRLKESAKVVTSILAAMYIEMSYWPENAQQPLSNYASLEKRYDRMYKKLLDEIAEAGGEVSGEEGGSGDDGYGYPIFYFGDRAPQP